MKPNRRVAVISGASGGLGQVCAKRLAEEGCDIVVADLKPAHETVALVERAGRHAMAVEVDITDPVQVSSLAERVRARFERCDILVNNAGMYSNVPIRELSYEIWRRYMALNLDAAFLLSTAFIPAMMEKRWGRIINMVSNSFFLAGPPGMVAYVTSKGGLIGLTRGLANDCGEHGITVNAVAPGPNPTAKLEEMFYAQAGASERTAFDSFMTGLAQNQAIKRSARPQDVEGAVAFLAGEDAAFVTGQTLVIDGGWARV